jgi:ring-1,2-phenylacetyl-CoA epoxidase subunit PaaC
MERNKELYNFVLRLADNSMVLAQRLAEWCSRGPILEEDLALTNVSLDLLGQAENFYNYAAQLGGENKSADDLAFLRSEREYFNSLLVEQPNGDFANTMMKQMLYSSFAKHLFEALLNSKDENLVGLAAKALKEVKYHFRHSSEWVIRFGNGTEESIQRLNLAINELWRFTADMFEMNKADEALIAKGISINLNDIYPLWKAEVSQILEEANLQIPETSENVKGGIKGIHTEHLGHMLCEMQYLQRAHPGANW